MVMLASVSMTGRVFAGWITIKNDTKQELAIQELVIVNGKPKVGKAIKLLPGESLREFHQVSGSKTVILTDPTQPNVQLAKGTIEWKKEDIAFSIQKNEKSVVVAAGN
jgi:hypothetical protein